jgi:hypothetical protein
MAAPLLEIFALFSSAMLLRFKNKSSAHPWHRRIVMVD